MGRVLTNIAVGLGSPMLALPAEPGLCSDIAACATHCGAVARDRTVEPPSPTDRQASELLLCWAIQSRGCEHPITG
jgi:hypothetical protein